MLSNHSSNIFALFLDQELRLLSVRPDGVRHVVVPLEGTSWGEIADMDRVVGSLRQSVALWQTQYSEALTHLDCLCVSSIHIRSMRTHGVTEIRQGRVAPYEVDEVYQSALKLGLPEGMSCYDAWPLCYEIDQYIRVTDPVGLEGRRLEGQFHVLALPANVSGSYMAVAKQAGLSVGSIVLRPLLLNLLPSAHAHHAGQRLVIDVGAESTSVAVMERHVCRYVAVYPMGESLLYRDLMTCLDMNEAQAKSLCAEWPQWTQKQSFRRHVHGVDSPVVSEILHARSLEMVESLYEWISDQLRWDLPLVIEVRSEAIEHYWHAWLQRYFPHALIEFHKPIYDEQELSAWALAVEHYLNARAARAAYVPSGWRYWWGRCKNWIEYHL